ncbi:MAG: UDP-N-acetylmuramoyl-L-alanine--D-glutamate ligase [Candidatus Curtissbacteria bacterium]
MIKNKKILVYGYGKEGKAAAEFLKDGNEIKIHDDSYGIPIGTDEHFDLIVRSPGVRPDHPLIKKLISKGAMLSSSTQMFFELCPCPVIGVTGTKGKGTTATLIYEMLKREGGDVHLAGNIGTPMLEVLPQLTAQSRVVLELSSFQLMDLKKSPHIAVVLMITQEHLDWHSSKDEYIKAKEPIVACQNEADVAIINQDFETSKSFAARTKAKVLFFSTQTQTNGAYLEGDKIMYGGQVVCATRDVLLPGKHNLQNVLAALSVAKLENVKNENIKKVLSSFKGLIHRLQLVSEVGGVKYYNDSFSTTPETTIAAIEAFRKPKILILGGSSKNSDFTSLGQTIVEDKTIKAIVLVGKEAGKIKEAIAAAGAFAGKILEGASNMPQIVKIAQSQALSGDIVILSPACASFDMFKNYQDRGEQFVNETAKLT